MNRAYTIGCTPAPGYATDTLRVLCASFAARWRTTPPPFGLRKHNAPSYDDGALIQSSANARGAQFEAHHSDSLTTSSRYVPDSDRARSAGDTFDLKRPRYQSRKLTAVRTPDDNARRARRVQWRIPLPKV